jgi:hypothetical protein
MGDYQGDIYVEYAEAINERPEVVWTALRDVRGAGLPTDGAEPLVEHDREPGAAHTVRPSIAVYMEERLTGCDPDLMLLRLEMIRCEGLPWSAYRSTFRVQPSLGGRSTVVATCLATPTAEMKVVEGMLRGMLVLTLQRLKAEVEGGVNQAHKAGQPEGKHA